jgi:hypothetical protein
VLLCETFMLEDDAATQWAFLTGAARYLVGAFEFVDGRDPATIHPTASTTPSTGKASNSSAHSDTFTDGGATMAVGR